MRQQLFKTVESILAEDERLVLLLGDIGVFGFRKAFEAFKGRVYNIGILEQSTISLAAGLSMEGFIPVVHSIAPFVVERCLEQLKIDFCYQGIGGNFISIGSSYDYAALGCTHHCPGDVGILKNLPGMEVILPGTAREFDTLFRQSYANNNPTYFRLSERENRRQCNVKFAKAEVIKQGKKATVIAVGPILEAVLEAGSDLDITILYYTTIFPFDADTLRKNARSSKILVCEPYYWGALSSEIMQAMRPKAVRLEHIGVPYRMLTNYGLAGEHDECLGLTPAKIREKIIKLE
ncbi:MAG: transketolase C-terminal domain-containing protein [Candidatus Omnitrophota bacterium]